MKTLDEILKIKAVVLYILNKMPQGLDYIHLFKVMYFAQQEHLKIYGMPLMSDSFIAKKHGPVPSFTYKAVKCAEGKVSASTSELGDFADSLTVSMVNGHQIVKASRQANCDMDELSRSNIRILDEWIDKCRNVESFDLSDLSHDKAWQQAKAKSERTGEDERIALYDMAKAAGANEAMLGVIRERQNTHRALAWI